MMLKGFKISNDSIQKTLTFEWTFYSLYPQAKICRIFTFSKWKNVTELFLNIKFAAVAKFPLDKVKP